MAHLFEQADLKRPGDGKGDKIKHEAKTRVYLAEDSEQVRVGFADCDFLDSKVACGRRLFKLETCCTGVEHEPSGAPSIMC